ncbi:MAG: DEAD/DEAH box helicase [Actinomycetales bacterium]|nr:DEAD/DEAH box helicase [Actinomycetales bacterium]
MTLPQALAGTDIIGQAKTGTGKTLGFAIPILQRILTPRDEAQASQPTAAQGKPQALVVVPTRELAMQVADDLETAGSGRGARVICLYGGRAYEPQIEQLQRGVDVVVGTPGRLLDLHRQRHLDLSHIAVLVLDEADEMLDMGFLPDVERIVAATPKVRQTMLFSATMPGQIISLARRYMSNPVHIRATSGDDEGSVVDAIEQHVWRAHSMDKPELLARIMQSRSRTRAMVFCRTKRMASRVCDELIERGFPAAAIHGDLGQGAREQALNAFRAKTDFILVATDVAARGIDVEGVSHVVNYECPEDDKTFLHRIGRTGRAGANGVAVTFVDWPDTARWQMINRTLGLPFNDPLETYSSSEHVFTGLDIPRESTGRLKPPSIPAPGSADGNGRDGARRGQRGESGRGRGGQGREGGQRRGGDGGSSSKPRSQSGGQVGQGRRPATRTGTDAAPREGQAAAASARPPRQRRRRPSNG